MTYFAFFCAYSSNSKFCPSNPKRSVKREKSTPTTRSRERSIVLQFAVWRLKRRGRQGESGKEGRTNLADPRDELLHRLDGGRRVSLDDVDHSDLIGTSASNTR